MLSTTPLTILIAHCTRLVRGDGKNGVSLCQLKLVKSPAATDDDDEGPGRERMKRGREGQLGFRERGQGGWCGGWTRLARGRVRARNGPRGG
jgi:hypothetical protein